MLLSPLKSCIEKYIDPYTGGKRANTRGRLENVSSPIVLEQHDPLITLREQRHDIRRVVRRHVTDLEPNRARKSMKNLSLVARAAVPVESQSASVVSVFADEKFIHTISVKIECTNEDRPEKRVDQDSGRPKRISSGKVVPHERAPGLIIGIENARIREREHFRSRQ